MESYDQEAATTTVQQNIQTHPHTHTHIYLYVCIDRLWYYFYFYVADPGQDNERWDT